MVLGEKHGTNYLPCTLCLLKYRIIMKWNLIWEGELIDVQYFDN